jgi:D-alanyl-D-alanine carboxypeptidase
MDDVRRLRRIAAAAPAATALVALVGTSQATAATASGVERAVRGLVDLRHGPPGAIAVLKRPHDRQVFRAGVAKVGSGRSLRIRQAMRIASVSKAFSGAAALRLARQHVLDLDLTIGQALPDLPAAWADVTLAELLHHTSGLPDFTGQDAFRHAVSQSPETAPAPRELLGYVEHKPLAFPAGTAYRYSNSDNIAAALMVEAVTGSPYARVLSAKVFRPFGLKGTKLPRGIVLPDPFIHGYSMDPLTDVSQVVAFGGWAWASGGIVSTPLDLTRFVRHYVSLRRGPFIPGDSDPRGPGRNFAGLAVFRYRTRCGTVYGHTGSILGYTQLIAANGAGTKSVTFTISTQVDDRILPRLRRAETKAVCYLLSR